MDGEGWMGKEGGRWEKLCLPLCDGCAWAEHIVGWLEAGT